jgi:hypothetical protein
LLFHISNHAKRPLANLFDSITAMPNLNARFTNVPKPVLPSR